MSSNLTQSSLASTLDKFIVASSSSTINAEVIVEEKSDSDDNADFFSESKGLSCEEFCNSVKKATNGLLIYNLVFENLARGNCLYIYFIYLYLFILIN